MAQGWGVGDALFVYIKRSESCTGIGVVADFGAVVRIMNGLMRGMGRCTGAVNYFRDYKRLALFAKPATSYNDARSGARPLRQSL